MLKNNTMLQNGAGLIAMDLLFEADIQIAIES